MRIGNGPALRIPRPGVAARKGWWRTVYKDYDLHLARERERFARMPSVTIADRKRVTGSARNFAVFRLVDGHGRSFGKRISWNPGWQRVRPVNQQPETLHSQASRVLKRAHRLSMRED